MKKILSILLTLALIAAMFVGCSAKSEGDKKEDNSNKLTVVTSIFPIYDWVRNIVGDDVHIDHTLLMSNGADLHNYQPTADDIIKISTCDIFIYVGGESDKWVDDTLKSAQNKDMKVVNLMEVLGDSAKEEELVEGMQGEEEEAEEGEEEEGPEYDEHVWLSLRNAKKIVSKISDVFAEVDSSDAQTFRDNAKAYSSKLDALDEQYKQVTMNAQTKTLLFADRFPFRYMTEDYGLKYFAAFIGCSAESEASFETISFLAKKVDELKLKSVITIDGSDQKIAKTVIENTKDKNQKILILNSMQSITEKNINDGETYLSIMESNLTVLKEALA